jgi:hypothetical protein
MDIWTLTQLRPIHSGHMYETQSTYLDTRKRQENTGNGKMSRKKGEEKAGLRARRFEGTVGSGKTPRKYTYIQVNPGPILLSSMLPCKRLRSPIDSEESIPPGWESIPGPLKGLQIRALDIPI